VASAIPAQVVEKNLKEIPTMSQDLEPAAKGLTILNAGSSLLAREFPRKHIHPSLEAPFLFIFACC
jgi:hypothetical protein